MAGICWNAGYGRKRATGLHLCEKVLGCFASDCVGDDVDLLELAERSRIIQCDNAISA